MYNKNIFHNAAVSIEITNNIIEVILTNVDFLYTKDGIHEYSMSFQNGSGEKRIKSKSVTTNSFLFNKIEPNSYTTRPSLSEIYIYIHISINKHSQETMR